MLNSVLSQSTFLYVDLLLQVHTFLTMSSLMAVGPTTYNTLTFTKSSLHQTDRNSFYSSYSCLDNKDAAMNAALAPGYPAYTKQNCELAVKQAGVLCCYLSAGFFRPVTSKNSATGRICFAYSARATKFHMARPKDDMYVGGTL
jgi:hypothetical protein